MRRPVLHDLPAAITKPPQRRGAAVWVRRLRSGYALPSSPNPHRVLIQIDAPLSSRLSLCTARTTYVAAASHRFGIPAVVIIAVMRRESGGDPGAVSRKGAIGLMQIMPGTWAELRARYRLGHDPFDERDNIFAGTANLREMHDRYGTVARMLAAYNAGPARVDDLRQFGRPLPRETRAYVAAILPSMGGDDAMDVSPVRPSDFRDAPVFAQRGGPPDAERPRSINEVSSTSEVQSFTKDCAPFASDGGSTQGLDSLFVRRGAEESWR